MARILPKEPENLKEALDLADQMFTSDVPANSSMGRAFTTLRRCMRQYAFCEFFQDGELPAELSVANQEFDDLARMTIVLSVSAIDDFFTKIFSETVARFLNNKGPNPQLTAMLREAGLDRQTALVLSKKQDPHREIQALVTRYLDRYVAQKAKAINRLFLCFGVKNFCKLAAGRTNKPNILPSIESLVRRRNEIVHSSDLDEKGDLRKINVAQLGEQIIDVLDFLSGATDIIWDALGIQPSNWHPSSTPAGGNGVA